MLNRAAQFAPDIDFARTLRRLAIARRLTLLLASAAFLLLLRFTLLDALHTVALSLGLEQFAPAVNISISLLNGRTSALSSLAARAPPPLRSIVQHRVGAALSLFQPDPPGVTVARLQEATLRDALSLCAAAAATPQARSVAIAVLTDLFELCTLLRFLACTFCHVLHLGDVNIA